MQYLFLGWRIRASRRCTELSELRLYGHTKGDDWWKKDERGGYYVTTEYYLLEGDWKRFADCKKSMTQIIEHLKEVRQ